MRRLLFLLCLCAPALASVVDRVLVVVDDELVLQSDLRVEAELATLDPSPSPFWSPTRGTSVQRLVDAALLRTLASSLDLYQPKGREVRARLDALRARFVTEADFQAFLTRSALDESLLKRAITRRMVVERYLDRNLHADPNTLAWEAALQAFLEQVRPRVSIRVVPEMEPR